MIIAAMNILNAIQTPISLQNAMDKAANQNLTTKQLELKLSELSLDRQVKNAAYYPTLQLNGSYSYNSKESGIEFTPLPKIIFDSKERYDSNIAIQEVLFAGFRIRESYQMSKTQYHSQQYQIESTKNQLRLAVGALFYQVQALRLSRDVLYQSRERVMNQLLYVRALLESKQAVPFDTLDASNRLLSIDTQIKRSIQTEDVMVMKFNNLINDPNTEYTPETIQDFKNSNQLQGLNTLLEMAHRQNTDVTIYNIQKKAQDSMIKIQRSTLYPQLVASASYHEAKPGTNAFANEWMNYYNVGIGFQWQIWDWKANYNKLLQQKYEKNRIDLLQQQALQNLDQQVTETYKNIQMTYDQIELQEKLTKQEGDRYIMIQDRYKESQISELDLSTGEKALTESQLNLKQQYVNLYVYLMQMDILTGKFIPMEQR